jgi:hypothetical protein
VRLTHATRHALQALYEGTRFDAVRRELTSQKALVTLMALVLGESHERALQGLRVLNACTQVRARNILEYFCDALILRESHEEAPQGLGV